MPVVLTDVLGRDWRLDDDDATLPDVTAQIAKAAPALAKGLELWLPVIGPLLGPVANPETAIRGVLRASSVMTIREEP